MLLSLYQVCNTLSSNISVTFVTISVFLFLGLHLDNSSVQHIRTDVKSNHCDFRHTNQHTPTVGDCPQTVTDSPLLTIASTRQHAGKHTPFPYFS